jgi:hypothetical protein
MNFATPVLALAKAEGVTLRLVDGQIRATRFGGAVPAHLLELLREHREAVKAHLTTEEAEERYGKAPSTEDAPPIRATKPPLTERQRQLAMSYVLRQGPPGSDPLRWIWCRADDYASWAKGAWTNEEVSSAALLDFLCWQRRATDAQALKWIEDMDGAYTDLVKQDTNTSGKGIQCEN